MSQSSGRGRARNAGRFVAAAILGWIVLSLACAQPKPTTQPASAEGSGSIAALASGNAALQPDEGLSGLPGRVHIVQPNDTLYSLAERYYGHGKHYRKIWSANRKRLSDPEHLPVGMKLIIP